jgi:hypothetical protein
MFDIRKFACALAAATTLGLAALPVSAATVRVVANAPASWALVNQADPLNVGAGSWTDLPSTVNGSLGGAYKSPFDPALANNGVDVTGGDVIPNWHNIQYYTVGSPAPNSAPSPAILEFAIQQSYLSLLWGSIDTYNAIALYLNGVLQDTVTGGFLLVNGGQPAASGAAFVKIAGSFDEVRFYSNYPGFGADTPAFEFSNVVATVPVPAGGLLLLGALGGLAALRRRKTA